MHPHARASTERIPHIFFSGVPAFLRLYREEKKEVKKNSTLYIEELRCARSYTIKPKYMEFKTPIIITNFRSYTNTAGYKNAEATILLQDGNVAKVMTDPECQFDDSLKGRTFNGTFVVKATKDLRLYVKLTDFIPV